MPDLGFYDLGAGNQVSLGFDHCLFLEHLRHELFQVGDQECVMSLLFVVLLELRSSDQLADGDLLQLQVRERALARAHEVPDVVGQLLGALASRKQVRLVAKDVEFGAFVEVEVLEGRQNCRRRNRPDVLVQNVLHKALHVVVKVVHTQLRQVHHLILFRWLLQGKFDSTHLMCGGATCWRHLLKIRKGGWVLRALTKALKFILHGDLVGVEIRSVLFELVGVASGEIELKTRIRGLLRALVK